MFFFFSLLIYVLLLEIQLPRTVVPVSMVNVAMLVTYHWRNLSLVVKMHFVYYKTSDHRNLEQKYNNVNYTSNMSKYIYIQRMWQMVQVGGHKAKRLVLQCFLIIRRHFKYNFVKNKQFTL
jgi:hypothetical protein